MTKSNEEWLVRIQIIRPDGTIDSANDYAFTENLVREGAFHACETADDWSDLHSDHQLGS